MEIGTCMKPLGKDHSILCKHCLLWSHYICSRLCKKIYGDWFYYNCLSSYKKGMDIIMMSHLIQIIYFFQLINYFYIYQLLLFLSLTWRLKTTITNNQSTKNNHQSVKEVKELRRVSKHFLFSKRVVRYNIQPT